MTEVFPELEESIAWLQLDKVFSSPFALIDAVHELSQRDDMSPALFNRADSMLQTVCLRETPMDLAIALTDKLMLSSSYFSVVLFIRAFSYLFLRLF